MPKKSQKRNHSRATPPSPCLTKGEPSTAPVRNSRRHAKGSTKPTYGSQRDTRTNGRPAGPSKRTVEDGSLQSPSKRRNFQEDANKEPDKQTRHSSGHWLRTSSGRDGGSGAGTSTDTPAPASTSTSELEDDEDVPVRNNRHLSLNSPVSSRVRRPRQASGLSRRTRAHGRAIEPSDLSARDELILSHAYEGSDSESEEYHGKGRKEDSSGGEEEDDVKAEVADEDTESTGESVSIQEEDVDEKRIKKESGIKEVAAVKMKQRMDKVRVDKEQETDSMIVVKEEEVSDSAPLISVTKRAGRTRIKRKSVAGGRKSRIKDESEEQHFINHEASTLSSSGDGGIGSSTESSSESLPINGRKRKLLHTPLRATRRNDQAQSGMTQSGSDSDDELPRVPRSKLRSRSRTTKVESRRTSAIKAEDPEEKSTTAEDDTTSEEEIQISPAKSEQERLDLDEDLDFLQPMEYDKSRAFRVKPLTPKQSARQKALDQLKRRRSHRRKAVACGSDQSEDGTEKERAGADPQTESPDTDGDVFQYTDARTVFTVSKDDEEFIDSADENLGVPVMLPVEFSSFATAKSRVLFKYAIEWMVQKKINPAFAMNDGVYELAFERLSKKAEGLEKSKYNSSVWTQDFTRALHARPGIEYYELSAEERKAHFGGCAACNRSSHPVSFRLSFSGRPYHRNTQEPVEVDESDSGEEDEGDVNSQGVSLPDADMEFFVGRFCMRNARLAHTFSHWRFHLYEWVVDYLDDHGYCTPARIVERDSYTTKKRRDCANEIVDEMDANGEVARLWRDFEAELNVASEAQVGIPTPSVRPTDS